MIIGGQVRAASHSPTDQAKQRRRRRTAPTAQRAGQAEAEPPARARGSRGPGVPRQAPEPQQQRGQRQPGNDQAPDAVQRGGEQLVAGRRWRPAAPAATPARSGRRRPVSTTAISQRPQRQPAQRPGRQLGLVAGRELRRRCRTRPPPAARPPRRQAVLPVRLGGVVQRVPYLGSRSALSRAGPRSRPANSRSRSSISTPRRRPACAPACHGRRRPRVREISRT